MNYSPYNAMYLLITLLTTAGIYELLLNARYLLITVLRTAGIY